MILDSDNEVIAQSKYLNPDYVCDAVCQDIMDVFNGKLVLDSYNPSTLLFVFHDQVRCKLINRTHTGVRSFTDNIIKELIQVISKRNPYVSAKYKELTTRIEPDKFGYIYYVRLKYWNCNINTFLIDNEITLTFNIDLFDHNNSNLILSSEPYEYKINTHYLSIDQNLKRMILEKQLKES